jgi:predicted nucleic acid-binding protein
MPKVYLETTIFNFPFAEDAPQYRADTLKLFDEIKAGKFVPYTSDYVVGELDDIKDNDKLKKMRALIDEYKIEVLKKNEETEKLAARYVSSGIIPSKYRTDALHIASATIAGLDIVVSLNFRHIVKQKTVFETEVVNTREGFKRVFIHAPSEIIENDE